MEDEVRSFLDKLDISPDEHFLLDGEPPEKVDEKRLQAFERGELTAREEEEIAYLVTHYRAWYEADRRLVLGEEIIAGEAEGGVLGQDVGQDESESGRTTPLVSSRNGSMGNRIQVLALAASLLVVVFSVGWVIWANQREQRANNEVATLRDELQQAKMDLGIVQKERLLEKVPSATSEMWIGDVSAELLKRVVPEYRGDPDVTSEALNRAETARGALDIVVQWPEAAGKAHLELAAVEITVRRLEAAASHLEKARESLGDDPAVDNVQAAWLIAKGDRESEDKAEELLKASTAKHPDFLPGLYNLALFLQRTKQFEESEMAWQEFLKREQRPAYRKAAELHLKELGSSFRRK